MEQKAKTYNKDKKFEAGKNGERNGDTMRRYYIDPEKGTGDGTSPEKAGRNWEELSPEPGDMVLFKRGSRIYGSLRTVGGTKERPVLYGAYGEGEKPVFCGCVDLSRKEAWRSCGNGIWECTEEVPAEEKDGADLEIATPEPVPRRRTVRKLRQASLDEEQSPKSPAAPVTTKEPVTPGGRVPSGERAERRSFYDLDFNALDRGLTPEQRQEWNSIYASYRGHSVLTGSIVGADPRVNRFRDRRTGRRVPLDDMYCATVILFRIPILIPAKEMWIKGEEREDFVLRSMGGASIDFVVTQVDREGCFAVASRRMAMQFRRYYFSTQPSLHSIGSRVKCRVLTVGPRRCLVECHGFDISLTQRDMSYTAIPDLRKQYHRGQELDCIVKDYDRREGRLVISVKETNPNPFDGAELRHPVRSRRQAVIAGKYAGGIFCNLPDGVVVMCSYSFQYDDAAFAIGDRVVVMIQRYDFHKKQIYGKIVAKW